MTDPDGRGPLNHDTVGWPILDDSAITRILEYVDLPLQEGVSRLAFETQLGTLISQALWHSFKVHPRQAQLEVRRLSKCIKDYFQLRPRLRELGLDPPDPPARWRGSMLAWLQEQEQFLKTPSKGGRYPETVTNFLLPRLLGLFQAAYGRTPTSTTSSNEGPEGPAARFIEKVIKETRATIDQVGFDPDTYGPAQRDKLTKQWRVSSPAALEKMIMRRLSLTRPAIGPDEATGTGHVPEQREWEIWAAFYRDQLMARSQG